MRQRLHLFRGVLAALFVVALGSSLAAQTGRVGGVVKDRAASPRPPTTKGAFQSSG
jgi:hypothetical protein